MITIGKVTETFLYAHMLVSQRAGTRVDERNLGKECPQDKCKQQSHPHQKNICAWAVQAMQCMLIYFCALVNCLLAAILMLG